MQTETVDTVAGEEGALVESPGLAKAAGWFWLICGGGGLIASFMLTLEYLKNLTDPDAKLICDLGVFVTCQPAMNSSAAAILGFPNIILGLVCFTIAVVTGVVMVSGIRLPKWYHLGLQLGLLGAATLITYLQWFTGWELRALCLWCMVIWTFTIPLATVGTITNLIRGTFGAGAARVGRSLASWWWVIVVVWYLAVIGLVLSGMWNTIALSLR